VDPAGMGGVMRTIKWAVGVIAMLRDRAAGLWGRDDVRTTRVPSCPDEYSRLRDAGDVWMVVDRHRHRDGSVCGTLCLGFVTCSRPPRTGDTIRFASGRRTVRATVVCVDTGELVKSACIDEGIANRYWERRRRAEETQRRKAAAPRANLASLRKAARKAAREGQIADFQGRPIVR